MKCKVRWCERAAMRDAAFCSEHLNDYWSNRLERLADGSYIGVARTPEWVRRARANSLPAVDLTGRAA